MTKRNTSIKINGKHYDALTGQLISDVAAPLKTKSIDGVVRSTSQHVAHSASKPKPAKPSSTRDRALHAKKHRVTPSKALMRHVVAKPAATSLKRHVKVQGSTLAVAHTAHTVRVAAKHSVHSVNRSRLTRAQTTSMSPQISRFAHELATHAPLAIEDAVAALDKAIVIPQTVGAPPAYRADITPAKQTKTNSSDVFERALQRATSHEQTAPISARSKKNRQKAARSLKHRMVSYSTGAVAVLAIAGFFGFQHADTIQFKVASNRAGFAATMPAYQPEGFDVESVRSYDGYVGLKYVADTINGTRSFAITEKPSNWNSDTLLTNIMSEGEHTAYTTIEQAGRTVYLYGRNQAAWVNKGILYQIAGDDSLQSQDFGHIAASM